MSRYSIKEVETLSGVKAHTLRIWEQRYHLFKPERTETNIRYFNDEQLRLLLNIATLNRSGMKISKIAGLKGNELTNSVMKVFEETFQPDNLLDSLVLAMIDFDEKRFEKTLSSAILKLGFEDAFTKIVFPFLLRTGVLWITGAVRVAQEHFISNLIRRKISAAIDGIYMEPNKDTRKFILFLPEGETHELLLLFTEYVLRKHHHHVAYIGASLPFDEVGYVAKTFKPDYLFTYQTVALEAMSLPVYLKKLSHAFPNCRILVGGSMVAAEKDHLPSNCIPVLSVNELLNAIN